MKFLVVVLSVIIPVSVFAQTPDSRDSIIVESKSVAPNLTGSPAFTVKVSITNKDSLVAMVLTLGMRTIAGTTYALLNRTGTGLLTYGSVVTNLTNTLRYGTSINVSAYDDTSPDSLLLYANYDPGDPWTTTEPPNAVRKPIWELKFRHSSDSAGQVLLDSTRLFGQGNYFTNIRATDILSNFLPGVITVEYQKGDLNLSGGAVLTAADIVWGIKAIFGATPPAGRSASDLNCDGARTIADVMLLLNAIFLQEAFPC